MPRDYSIRDINAWKFAKLPLPEEWANHMGNISENFRMMVQGPSGHGKTEYVMKLAKMLSQYYGKVNFNSTEQGRSDTFKEAWKRNAMQDMTPGKFKLCGPDKRKFEPWFKSLQRPNSGRVIILDSIDYMELKVNEFKELHERFKRTKSIVVVCWDDPMDTNSKKIKYMCDIKVEIRDFKAKIRSRFGGNKPLVIWDQKEPKMQLELSIN